MPKGEAFFTGHYKSTAFTVPILSEITKKFHDLHRVPILNQTCSCSILRSCSLFLILCFLSTYNWNCEKFLCTHLEATNGVGIRDFWQGDTLVASHYNCRLSFLIFDLGLWILEIDVESPRIVQYSNQCRSIIAVVAGNGEFCTYNW